jgi:hypothetical protein|tara:strand:+ start:579 stop:779 length:201 start_codon:yes stop_codon:yes gene_type:complete
MNCELCQKNPCQCADKFKSTKSREFDTILIDLINVHYNHDKLMSTQDFDTYCLLAEETYNQENGEV